MSNKSDKKREPKKENNISPSLLKATRNKLETLLTNYVENHKDQILAIQRNNKKS